MNLDQETRLWITAIALIASIIVSLAALHKASVFAKDAELGRQAKQAFNSCEHISNCEYEIKRSKNGFTITHKIKQPNLSYGVH